MTQPVNERFYYQTSFEDTVPDVTMVAALFTHVLDWAAAHPEYSLQTTTIQYDIVRAPFSGGPYAFIIWYAEAV